MDKELKKNDKVVLRIRTATPTPGITPGLRELDGKTFRVKRIRVVKAEEASSNRGTYYELKGCESAQGAPYAILREWLLPV